MGVFRSVEHPSYNELMGAQLEQAAVAPGDDPALDALLRGADAWTIA